MAIAVVDSGGANITSVMQALHRLGAEAVFTADPGIIRNADRVILPGVGSAGAAMAQLRKNGLDRLIPGLRQPVLGICLGMQLLFARSAEADTPLLGLIEAQVDRLEPSGKLRVPHMGWNRISIVREDPLVAGLDRDWFYFVHSFAAPPGPYALAECAHGKQFSTAVKCANFRGVQFHPERSARAGARLLRNFLELPCT